jgi:hypothetical protein
LSASASPRNNNGPCNTSSNSSNVSSSSSNRQASPSPRRASGSSLSKDGSGPQKLSHSSPAKASYATGGGGVEKSTLLSVQESLPPRSASLPAVNSATTATTTNVSGKSLKGGGNASPRHDAATQLTNSSSSPKIIVIDESDSNVSPRSPSFDMERERSIGERDSHQNSNNNNAVSNSSMSSYSSSTNNTTTSASSPANSNSPRTSPSASPTKPSLRDSRKKKHRSKGQEREKT